MRLCHKHVTVECMQTMSSRKLTKDEKWPKEVKPGRTIVRVYRRKTPSGNFSFLVANYADDGNRPKGKRRRMDAYPTAAEAIEAATLLANRLDAQDYVAASMTKEQAISFANSESILKPFGISVDAATAAVAESLRIIGGFDDMEKVKQAAAQGQPMPDLFSLQSAAKDYSQRLKHIKPKRVAEAVVEMLELKKARGHSDRYVRDLKGRLGTKFANDFKKDCRSIATSEIQVWLNQLKLSTQSYDNYKRALSVFFDFCVSLGYVADNPIKGVQNVKVRNGEIEIFTPLEITRLLSAASSGFVPSLALGAFAGLRSAEIERLEWEDIHLADRHIVIGKDKAKTASRRIVRITDNLASWLALTPEAKRKGKVWAGGWLYKEQQVTAAATAVKIEPDKNILAKSAVKWKANALRHSFASYSFALTNDAGQIAGIMGNSAKIVNRHYRQLTTPTVAKLWFGVYPPASAKPHPTLSIIAPLAQPPSGNETEAIVVTT